MLAPKAVLDTNVLIGLAFAQRGIAKTMRELLAEEAFTLVTAADLLAELYRVLHYPRIRQRFHPTEDDILEFMGILLERALVVPGRYQVRKVASTPPTICSWPPRSKGRPTMSSPVIPISLTSNTSTLSRSFSLLPSSKPCARRWGTRSEDKKNSGSRSASAGLRH
jgi:putative PIN family toxin of toxin-antitoxin system